jgi:DNA-binding LacI/PurR family transcriptional regulator
MARDSLNRSKAGSVTSRDVALKANVSQALVSRAFSGNGRIAPATRERILGIAAEIGWSPNALAASMVTGDAPLVAVITAKLNSSEWRTQVLSHLLGVFEAWRIKPILFYAESDDEVDRLLGETLSWRTRGVIVTAGEIQQSRADAILSKGQFLASLNRPAHHPGAFAVATDNALGGSIAADLLAPGGKGHLLVLAGPRESWASSLRTEGFCKAAQMRGVQTSIWHNEAMSTEVGKQAAEAYLALTADKRPGAVFATNDAMALGFIDGMRGHDAAANLPVVGFDNLPVSSWAPYQLTTFEQPIAEMVDCVLKYIEWHQRGALPQDTPQALASHRSGPDGVHYFAPRLIVRATAKPAS